MTSRRLRKLKRANSLAGILRQVRLEQQMSSPLDAASWRPDGYGTSPWNKIVDHGYGTSPWNKIVDNG